MGLFLSVPLSNFHSRKCNYRITYQSAHFGNPQLKWKIKIELGIDFMISQKIIELRIDFMISLNIDRTQDRLQDLNVISSVSHFFAASQGPNVRHFPLGHAMICAVILSCIYFPWHIRERKEQRRAMIHPPRLQSPWLSSGTEAETKKMTISSLEKLQVNADNGSNVRGGGK